MLELEAEGEDLFFEAEGVDMAEQILTKQPGNATSVTIWGIFTMSALATWHKEANYAELEEEDELLLMAYVELHDPKRKDAWFVYSCLFKAPAKIPIIFSFNFEDCSLSFSDLVVLFEVVV